VIVRTYSHLLFSLAVLSFVVFHPGSLVQAQTAAQTYPNNSVIYFRDNTNALGKSMFIYGDDSNRLDLGTGNTTRITIDSVGRVGIGTREPTGQLEIAGGNQIIGNNGTIYFRDSNGSLSQSMFILGDTWNRLNLGAGNWTQITITPSGNVGVGTMNPSTKFHVVGNAQVDGNIAAKYQDVAEWVKVSGAIPSGTVVVTDAEKSNHAISSEQAYDSRVIGVVSERPGVLLGEAGEDKVMVAHSGRVRMKVDAGYAPIALGDLLVTSSTPGYAMRSQPVVVGGAPIHRPGTLIGKALEPLADGKGEILVLLMLQ